MITNEQIGEQMTLPEFAVLVNQEMQAGFVLRLKEPLKMAETVIVETDGSGKPVTVKALDTKPWTAVCQAVLLLSPYIKIAAPAPEGLVAQIRRGRLTFLVEGEVVLADCPVEDHFGDPKVSVSGKQLFSLKAKHLFEARRVGIGDNGEQMTSDEVIGMFLSNQNITAVITGIPSDVQGKMEVEIGVVAGLYTSLTEEQEKETYNGHNRKPD